MSLPESPDPSLAVFAKLRLIYEEKGGHSDEFVSFEQPPLPWTMDDLDFIRGETSADEATRQQRAADFATWVNRVPEPLTAWKPRTSSLPEVYEQLFDQTQWGEIELSEQEKEELAEAKSLSRDEEITEKYHRYQKEYQEVQQEYNSTKITAEFAESEEVRAEAELELERLAEKKEAALNRWRTLGYKAEWESATATMDQLESSGPDALRDYESTFDKFFVTSTHTNQSYYETDYYPRDFATDESERAWMEVTLDGSEVDSLCKRARDEMPELTDSSLTDNDIQASLEVESLSFEIGTIEIRRPWFSSELLRSRYWRWRSRNELSLSDGGDPPRGRLPCYVSKLIFGRNLSVKLKNSKRNRTAMRRLQSGDFLTLGPFPLEQLPSTTSPEVVDTIGAAQFDATEVESLRALERGFSGKPDEPNGSEESDTPTDEEVDISVEHAEVLSNDARLSRIATLVAGNDRESPPEPSDDESRDSSSESRDSDDELEEVTVKLNRPIAKLQPRVVKLPTGKRINTIPGRVPENDPKPVKPDGGFTGTVRESTDYLGLGDPIAGVKLSFQRDEGDFLKTAISDQHGRYHVTLPEGRYAVTARKEGYETYSTKPDYLTVEGDEPEIENVILSPAQSPSQTVDIWDTMHLAGIVCREVPKSPNPDPALSWD